VYYRVAWEDQASLFLCGAAIEMALGNDGIDQVGADGLESLMVPASSAIAFE
jgi:hypothetical protein